MRERAERTGSAPISSKVPSATSQVTHTHAKPQLPSSPKLALPCASLLGDWHHHPPHKHKAFLNSSKWSPQQFSLPSSQSFPSPQFQNTPHTQTLSSSNPGTASSKLPWPRPPPPHSPFSILLSGRTLKNRPDHVTALLDHVTTALATVSIHTENQLQTLY